MTPHRRVLALALTLTSLAVTDAGAQRAAAQSRATDTDASWVHESWTVKDGLPVNSINAILQDRRGYIWAATYDGLVRFDGVRFTVFNSANSAELPSNRIVQLEQGRDGALWIATVQGNVVRFRDGKFMNVPFEDGAPRDRVASLFVDSAGSAWIGNAAGLWKAQGDRLVHVAAGAIAAPVTTITSRRDGGVWIGTSRAGIYRVSGDGTVAKVVSDPAIDADSIVAMLEDRDGSLWVAGHERLWSWRDRPIEIKAAGRSLSGVRLVDIPTSNTVFVQALTGTFRIDSAGAVQIGPAVPIYPDLTIGLWADDRRIWTVDGQDVFRDQRRVFRLPSSAGLTAAVFDHEGSLWLGTRADGLLRLKPGLFTTYGIPEGLAAPNVYPTYVDRSGAVWAATLATMGASRIDPATGRITLIGERLLRYVNSFYQDSTGRLWAGGQPGLYACDPPAWTCRAEGPADLQGRSIFAMYADAAGVMWVGGAGRLYRYDGTWTGFAESSGAPAATVHAFATTRDGALWMGTNGGGLSRYANGSFTRLTRADGLPSDVIRSLYADADGWLWVGTEGRGLARVDARALGGAAAEPTIVRIGSADGLFDEVIHQIIEDDAGRLWMNTNRGIFWVPRTELMAFADRRIPRIHSTGYSERDGLRNREGNGGVQPAGARGPDGRIWFPTQNGVVVVDPADVSANRPPPPLVVEQIIANGRAIRPERDSIALSPEQRDAQIEYTALTFLEPANVRFRYRLDNYDRTWVDVGSRRTAFYTKLPPGRYTFRVQAIGAVGQWHEPGAALAIRVLPRFWETAAFRWAVVATLGAMLIIAARWRDARLRSRAADLERIVDERTAALRESRRELAERNEALQSVDQAKTRFFANVSHELRTPLTLTIGPLEDLRARTAGDPTVERWLDIALRNARRLLRLVNQLLDVAKLDAGAMKLEPRPLDLAPFTRGIVAAFSAVAERNGIRLTTTVPDALPGGFDADAVEKILTNLVSNAIKFTPAGGAVDVTLSRENGAAHWRVRDTGPGIPADQLDHVFERFYRVDESTSRTQPGTGIGLSLVKELLELHGGQVGVASDASGTTFTATIPVREAPTIDVESPPADAPTRLTADLAPTGEHDAMRPAPGVDEHGQDVPTLLVVDDSADLRAYIREHFEPRYRVVESADGADGIERARALIPDLVISDVMMPGVSGDELCRTLRASADTDFIPIILLTARASSDDRIEGLLGGADDYLGKPFEMRELEARVDNLIATRRRLRERFGVERAEVRDSAHESHMPAGDRAFVERLRETIASHVGEPDFGVAELADALYLDRSHLFRRTRELLGETPSDLIRRVRLERAATLLSESAGTVAEVAYGGRVSERLPLLASVPRGVRR